MSEKFCKLSVVIAVLNLLTFGIGYTWNITSPGYTGVKPGVTNIDLRCGERQGPMSIYAYCQNECELRF